MQLKPNQDARELLARIAKAEPRRARAMERHVRVKDAKPALIVAYDFETSRIEPGTPRPLYLTAYHPDLMHWESPIESMAQLQKFLRNYFLIDQFIGAKFCAWYGNGFDAYFIAAALVTCDDLVLRPYLTKSKTLRGLRVLRREDANRQNAPSWEFLDAQAMLGLAGVSLAKFLNNFAPDHAKLVGVIDFEREEFDAANPKHREYAMRDSVGLWHGVHRAQSILLEKFNQPLAVTMGGACIKIFKAHIPEGVSIPVPRSEVLDLTREYAMRGGYCYCVRRYEGPVWKYDLNQAYAAAMREARMPCGFTQRLTKLPSGPAIYLARVSATHSTNRVPFYYRTQIGGRVRSMFGASTIAETWVTSIEVEQLQREGWVLDVHECWAWGESFSMTDYVNRLEFGRMHCEGGPSGPIGTMFKMVGNHSYGKTVEQIEPIEFVIASQCPEGYIPYYGDDGDPIEHIFFRFVDDMRPKDYHQPQIGAFITAHVRMVLRRAALVDVDAWLYADTDCLVFSRDVTDKLDIHPSRYGAWKIEEAGTRYQIIAKKVYSQIDGDAGKRKRSAKGMNVKRLSEADFSEWFEGRPPVQDQVQRQNFLAVLQGAEMYRAQKRSGTAVSDQAMAKRGALSSQIR